MVPLTKFSAYHAILRFMISVAIGTLVGDALMVSKYDVYAFGCLSISLSSFSYRIHVRKITFTQKKIDAKRDETMKS